MNPLALWRREADFDGLLRPIHEEADRTMLVMCGFLQLVCLTWHRYAALGGQH